MKKNYNKGDLINGLEVVEYLGVFNRNSKAIFKCGCGKQFESFIHQIKSGRTKSCGCYKKNNPSNLKHGDTKKEAKHHYVYKTWESIKRRCFTTTKNRYDDWGGRGVIMYPEWIDNYPLFKEWVLTNLGERPEGMSIDREDNDGNYVPNNLRWATVKVQNWNKRNTFTEEQFNDVLSRLKLGETHRSIAESYGVDRTTVTYHNRKLKLNQNYSYYG